MIKNYCKTALRNLFKNGLFSFINISGLALAMAGAGLLIINIQYELSVDQFQEKKDRVFKVYNKSVQQGRLKCFDQTVVPLGPVLQRENPQIVQMARVAGTHKLFNYNGKKLQVGGYHVDASFLDMFSFPLAVGNAHTVLKDQQSIIITESLAQKLFGAEDPLNKTILLDSQGVTVAGILKDVPLNSSIRFDYLLPWQDNNNNWDAYIINTYVELKEATQAGAVNNQIRDLLTRHSKNEIGTQLFLHPIGKMHIQHHFDPKGNPETESDLYFLPILAGLMLLIGSINFMNLSTARSEKRAKEVGVRKVMGAARHSLILQFIIESIVLALIAGGIAMLIIQLVWPAFSNMARVPIDIPWQSPLFWLSALAFILFTGLLAGSYPAFYLSSFRPVKVLKGIFQKQGAMITPRRVLVVTQFVIAILLINFTIIFQKQVTHTEARELGFVKENLLFHSLTKDLSRNYNMLQNELQGTGMVAAICKSSMPLTRPNAGLSGLEWAGGGKEGKSVPFSLFATTGNFVRTHGLTLVAGRDLDINTYRSDSTACLVNESALKAMRMTEAVGQNIMDDGVRWKIVGVVKDFYQQTPDRSARPALIRFGDGSVINIRLKKEYAAAQHFIAVENILKKYNPGYITEMQFADADLATLFNRIKNISKLINSFALIAIFIACMGLLGLTAYMAESRKREIGIRKVLGASVAVVTSLLTKDFIKLVVISILIASPLAWLAMHSFLQQFSYRTNASWWILPLSGAIAIFIAVVTIGLQAVRSAIANPVDTLRSE